ncbi:serine/threonine-protein kinase [Antrihabitans spumae]|uniref:Serine/threonine-protein kinase n=1 Tax=Antrihabitans spumae TaxID=3373370 RepID=A0ABW7JQT1_9NOCA
MNRFDAGRPSLHAADAVGRFTVAWATAAAPPELAAFLPDPDAIRIGTLLELIRIDLRQRSLRGAEPKHLADYRAEFPELTADLVPLTTVHEDFVIRQRRGENVDPEQYLLEYPAHAEQLRGLLTVDDETAYSTADVTNVADRTATHRSGSTTVARPGPFEPLEELAVGQRVDEFDLLTSLGSGAFARVFLARQRSMQRLVAVKISEDRGTEPQTLAQLDHDYIVRVFDQRLVPERELRLLYMQYLPGGTLLNVLRNVRRTTWEPSRSGQFLLDAIDESMESRGEIRLTDSSIRTELAALSWPETIAWLGRRLADALDYADRHDVLHRDVKPANVLLTAEGVPKLADFNISFSGKVAGASPVAYFGGSLSYMSPEQLEACHPGRPRTAAELDTRSDIFSLGVVLWELLTGRKPFPDNRITGSDELTAGDNRTLDALLDDRLAGVSADALDDLPPDTPSTLRRVLLTCLAPDPNDRWQSGGELAQQFDLALDHRARDLVDPPERSWRLRLRKWLVPIVALCVVIPNGIASLYNIQQNQMLIFSRLSERAQQRTELLALLVNTIGFGLGLLLIVYLSRRLLTVPGGLRKGRTYSADTLAKARGDALLLSRRIVAVVFGLWMLSGVSWPFGLASAEATIPVSAYVHFIAAQVVCAAIAVAYPFFLLTFYSVRCIYPIFLPYSDIDQRDAALLRRLRSRNSFYLALAASVPLLAVATVTFLDVRDIPSVFVAVRILCVGALVAFAVSYWLFRLIDTDLESLERVVANS